MLYVHGGRVIHRIVQQLERLGYRWSYRVVDALAFGVPQRRARFYLLASLEEDPAGLLFKDDFEPVLRRSLVERLVGSTGLREIAVQAGRLMLCRL